MSDKDQQSIIEACKAYLMFQKIGLQTLTQKIIDFYEREEVKYILTAVTDCVFNNNSFNCDESIANRIMAIERQKRMDNFLTTN